MDTTLSSFLDAWNRSQNLATPALHERIAQWFGNRIANGSRRLLLLAFRGSGKSTLLGLLAAWLLKCDPDRRILVLAAESQLATKTVRTVRRILERHPDTQALRPGKPEEWAADRLTVPRPSVSRDPSLLARGIGANITGSHADAVICDDVEVPNTCGTPAKRADLRARLSEIDYVLSPGGFQIYSGTPHSYYSIYAEDPRPEEDEELPFLHDFRRWAEPLDGDAWPERYTTERLETIRRRSGPARFASQMLLQPVQAVEGRLNAEWLRRYEGGLEYSEANGEPVLRLEGRRLVSASAWWDPAYGKPEKGDASVLAAVYTDEDGRRLLHRVVYTVHDPNAADSLSEAAQLCRQVAAQARKLRLPAIHVEKNGLGIFLPGILKRQLERKGYGTTVQGVHNSRPKHERILEAFDAPLAAGTLWAHASVFQSPFLRELREWRPGGKGRDDGLDAAACALLAEPYRFGPRGRAPRKEWRPTARPGRARSNFRV